MIQVMMSVDPYKSSRSVVCRLGLCVVHSRGAALVARMQAISHPTDV